MSNPEATEITSDGNTSSQSSAVLVSGALGAVGQACVETLSRRGVNCLLHDVRDAGDDGTTLSALAARARSWGATALAVQGDVRSEACLVRIRDVAAQRLQGLGACIWCVGEPTQARLAHIDIAKTTAHFDLELSAALNWVRFFHRDFAARQVPGSFVLCSGALTLASSNRDPVGTATAYGMAGLTRSLGLELRRHRQRINLLGVLSRSRLTEHLPLIARAKEGSFSPMWAGAAAVALLHPGAEHINGEIFGVAGARTYRPALVESPGVYASEPDVDIALKHLVQERDAA